MGLIWRSHTTAILIGGVVLVVLASAIAFMVTQFQPRTEVQLGSGVFQVKVAQDPTSRAKGLSGVTSIGPNEGLLFVFDTEEKWGIWMKDMKIPLDIIWLDSNKKVVHIVKDAAPELSTDHTFEPTKAAKYVLELRAGATSEYSIKIGDAAVFTVGGQ
jgi:uncharacterized membrane protein (UPF0127 family)